MEYEYIELMLVDEIFKLQYLSKIKGKWNHCNIQTKELDNVPIFLIKSNCTPDFLMS